MAQRAVLSGRRDQGAPNAHVEELSRHFLTDKRGRINYAVHEYMQRLQRIGSETGDIKGVLIEWEEVRISDDWAQTLLKIQILTNVKHQLLEIKIECRKTRPYGGRDGDIEMLNRTKYGRLLINAEIYPCVKGSCIALDATRQSRIGEMQIQGQERKMLTISFDGETGHGDANLFQVRVARLLGQSPQIAGLTNTQ